MMKVDIEKLRDQMEEMEEELKMAEDRLNTRITNVDDVITLNLGQKVSEIEKRVTKMEKANQAI